MEIEKVPISKFKATCLALLDRIKRTGQPILVTRKGEPIAQIIPPPAPKRPGSWVGSFASRGKIVGDIIAPAVEQGEWDVLQP
jgi:prevent-host-death family protein